MLDTYNKLLSGSARNINKHWNRVREIQTPENVAATKNLGWRRVVRRMTVGIDRGQL